MIEEKMDLNKRKNIICKRIDDLGVYKANLFRFKANQTNYVNLCQECGKASRFMCSWAEKRIEFLDTEMQSIDMEVRVLFKELRDIDARLVELVQMSEIEKEMN